MKKHLLVTLEDPEMDLVMNFRSVDDPERIVVDFQGKASVKLADLKAAVQEIENFINAKVGS